jgi:hypothetical protein
MGKVADSRASAPARLFGFLLKDAEPTELLSGVRGDERRPGRTLRWLSLLG